MIFDQPQAGNDWKSSIVYPFSALPHTKMHRIQLDDRIAAINPSKEKNK